MSLLLHVHSRATAEQINLQVNKEQGYGWNREYRKKDHPTDVITFALFADSEDDEKFIFEEEVNLGEILISIDTIKKQAKESVYDELLVVSAHGILHLLGFDHLTEEDYKFMVDKQNLYKAALNVKVQS